MTEHTPTTGLRAVEAAAEALKGVTGEEWFADTHHTQDYAGRTHGFLRAKGELVPLASFVLGVEGMPQDGGRAALRLAAYARQGVPALAAELTASLERERVLRGILREIWGCSFTSTETTRSWTVPLDLFNRVHLVFFPDQGKARALSGESQKGEK